MNGHSFEIEIKSLLGDKAEADALVEKMQKTDKNLVTEPTHRQLNHYFEGGNLAKLYASTDQLLPAEDKARFSKIHADAKTFSVRTRQADDKVFLVVKASVDDTTSDNGTARIELETPINLKLDELDQLVLESGFEYQAKWSRERTVYQFKEVTVSIDRNAGYGYLAEFEKVIKDQAQADKTKNDLRKLMSELGVEELPQDRLERMFAYYNAHWQDYYGTDKVFNVA